MKALTLSSMTGHLIVVQDEGQVDVGKLQEGGHGVGKCWAGTVKRSASHQVKWGPHPSVALASLEGLSTLAAAEEKATWINLKRKIILYFRFLLSLAIDGTFVLYFALREWHIHKP